jgi:hypothetical protein
MSLVVFGTSPISVVAPPPLTLLSTMLPMVQYGGLGWLALFAVKPVTVMVMVGLGMGF